MPEKTHYKITVIIPCYNEEKGLARILNSFPRESLKRNRVTLDVLVVDNNSTDRTSEIAKKFGARVIHETRKGKGNAVKTGFKNIPSDTDYVVMMDGDATYSPREIMRMVEPLVHNFSHVVVGSRLGGKMMHGALKSTNRLVNWGFTFLVRQFYQTNVTDVLSGYFAWKRKVVTAMLPHLNSGGFSIVMEMITKMHRLGFEICSVPITYDRREGETKIESIKDGLRILRMFFKNLFWHPDSATKQQVKTIMSYL